MFEVSSLPGTDGTFSKVTHSGQHNLPHINCFAMKKQLERETRNCSSFAVQWEEYRTENQIFVPTKALLVKVCEGTFPRIQ